jgi:hypothetical protein
VKVLKLYLGVVPGLFPWQDQPEIGKAMRDNQVGIIFSYWAFKKHIKELTSKGFHDFFSHDGPIMIDSGAYSTFNSGASVSVQDYHEFLKGLDIRTEDVVVNLDVIGDLNRSEENWCLLSSKFDHPILPVIHWPEKKIPYQLGHMIGLGGMVPAFKINQPGSVHAVASWIVEIKESTKANSIQHHGFGIGSPFHQVAFEQYLTSVDWIGWRRNAAVCSCYTPEGSTFVHEARKKKKKGKALTATLFEKYAPPFLESIEELSKPGTEGWTNRALWNVWWFLEAKNYSDNIRKAKYVQSIQKVMGRKKMEVHSSSLDDYLFTK